MSTGNCPIKHPLISTAITVLSTFGKSQVVSLCLPHLQDSVKHLPTFRRHRDAKFISKVPSEVWVESTKQGQSVINGTEKEPPVILDLRCSLSTLISHIMCLQDISCEDLRPYYLKTTVENPT